MQTCRVSPHKVSSEGNVNDSQEPKPLEDSEIACLLSKHWTLDLMEQTPRSSHNHATLLKTSACNTYPTPAQQTCRTYVTSMQHLCHMYAANMQHLCNTFAARMKHLCRTYANTCAATCNIETIPTQHLCRTYAALCNTYAAPMQHLCSSYSTCMPHLCRTFAAPIQHLCNTVFFSKAGNELELKETKWTWSPKQWKI